MLHQIFLNVKLTLQLLYYFYYLKTLKYKSPLGLISKSKNKEKKAETF